MGGTSMFQGVTWGVTVAEVLEGALDFILLFKDFLVLGIALILAPMLITFFKGILRNRRRA